MKTIFLIIVTIGLSIYASFAQTNRVFKILDDWNDLPPSITNFNAQTNLELMPESMFTNGNWGTEVEGVRVSLRFDKETYRVGEPIIATVIVRNTLLRNVTNKIVHTAMTYPLPYSIINTLNNTQVKKIDPLEPIFGETMTGSLPAGMQDRLRELFGTKYDLRKGTYTVQLTLEVRRTDKPGYAEVKSAPATLKIEDLPEPGKKEPIDSK
jgi:hypothetical protein